VETINIPFLETSLGYMAGSVNKPRRLTGDFTFGAKGFYRGTADLPGAGPAANLLKAFLRERIRMGWHGFCFPSHKFARPIFLLFYKKICPRRSALSQPGPADGKAQMPGMTAAYVFFPMVSKPQ
jgi:hypothetical protein